MKKTYHFVLTIFFVTLLFVGAISFWILPDRNFSETEKRGLQTLPRFTLERLLTGKLSSDVNDYFADQFPARDLFVAVKGTVELVLGKGENNGILLGANGQLARRLFEIRRSDGSIVNDMDLFDASHVDGAIRGITEVGATLDVPFAVLLPPRTIDVANSAFRYPSAYGDALSERLKTGIGDGVCYLDLLPLYRDLYENGEYVYYKTDHHWTTLGAYYAYVEIMRAFGMQEETLLPEAFERRVAASDFYGTFYTAGGMKFVSPDRMEIWYRGNEADFEIVADGVPLRSFYNEQHVTAKDHYATFLDGTHDVVTVTMREGTERPRLVIFKDSFANALAPFLAQHFDLVLLNLSSVRHDYTNVTERASEYGADAVLLIYTIGNVINTDRMNRLQ